MTDQARSGGRGKGGVGCEVQLCLDAMAWEIPESSNREPRDRSRTRPSLSARSNEV